MAENYYGDAVARAPISQQENHLACVLLLDTSGSMHGTPIKNLTAAVNRFAREAGSGDLTGRRVDVAVVEFNSNINLVQAFRPLLEMEPVTLNAYGGTSMGLAVETAVTLVRERGKRYDELGVPKFQPWIVMITDGEPTDNIENAVAVVRDMDERKGRIKFFSLAVGGANVSILQRFSKRVIKLEGFDFTGFFDWLCQSMSVIAASEVGDQVQLADLHQSTVPVPGDW
jgi:uncharacterized protein YegL